MTLDIYQTIKTVSVLSAETDKFIPIQRIWNPRSGKKVILAFLPHLGDLNSWEYTQQLFHYLPTFEENNVKLVVIGIGTIEGAREFAKDTGFPLHKLYLDQEGSLHKTLGFSKGFGDKLPVNPYVKLLPMLAGIGSPGTIQEVLRGYLGNKNVDAAWIYSNLRLVDASRFDIIRKEGQRPFELASLRLQNMIQILRKWELLSPPDKKLITQQGGTIVFDGKDAIYQHKDMGILKYTPIERVVQVTCKI